MEIFYLMALAGYIHLCSPFRADFPRNMAFFVRGSSRAIGLTMAQRLRAKPYVRS